MDLNKNNSFDITINEYTYNINIEEYKDLISKNVGQYIFIIITKKHKTYIKYSSFIKYNKISLGTYINFIYNLSQYLYKLYFNYEFHHGNLNDNNIFVKFKKGLLYFKINDFYWSTSRNNKFHIIKMYSRKKNNIYLKITNNNVDLKIINNNFNYLNYLNYLFDIVKIMYFTNIIVDYNCKENIIMEYIFNISKYCNNKINQTNQNNNINIAIINNLYEFINNKEEETDIFFKHLSKIII